MKAILQITILIGSLTSTIHAAGTVFSTLLNGNGQEYATAVTSDPQGNTYVVGLTYSTDFPVTAGAYQTKFGGSADAFITKLGPDGKIIWSTFLGGILDEIATSVAVDSAGNVLVAGYTGSPNFPVANALSGAIDGGATDYADAFVAKFDPTGSKLLYSTFLGGIRGDSAAGIAVDSAGNAYVVVNSDSQTGYPGTQNLPDQSGIFVSKISAQGALVYSYLHPGGSAGGIAVDTAGAAYVAGSNSASPSGATHTFGPAGSGYAFVFKISADGTRKIYETALGGSVRASAAAIVVNGAGEVYFGGNTSSVDFPLVHPIQSSPGARPLFKSTNNGAAWTPIDNLPFALPAMMVVDPSNSNTLYEASGDLGVFKSIDGGATWTSANKGIASTNVQTLGIDPVHPQTLYAATGYVLPDTSTVIYKSVDGAATWTKIDTSPSPVTQISVDAQNPNIVYEVDTSLAYSNANIRKTTDGGATWNALAFPATIQSLALDPHVSGVIVGASNEVFLGPHGGTGGSFPFIYRSVDGGATWVQGPASPPNGIGLIVDGSTNPSTFYDDFRMKSVDGGLTWTAMTPPVSGVDSSAMAADAGGTLYGAFYNAGIFTSRDHGQTWTPIPSPVIPSPPNSPVGGPPVIGLVPLGSTGTLISTIGQTGTSGFVSKLSADGSTLIYSTYLGAHASTGTISTLIAEPNIFYSQSWISGMALDASGNVVVAGGTRGFDLPTVKPAQALNGGRADAFAATLSPDGSQLTYSTYFGGSQDDAALAAGIDSLGNVLIAGQTWSGDFPTSAGGSVPYSYGDAFVTKLASGPPAITKVVNGASFLSGIEGGSWVTIQGTNLANTNPGRTWRADEVAGGNLPTSLDGVSVMIDGKPAYVYYISPTQINVQAPTDSATGAVNVVVTNNGNISPTATAQLQPAAPAFFGFANSTLAVASRLPDYAVVADPSIVPGLATAKPGDLLILWGTGFGATTPLAPAGTVVNGAPATSAVTVTVGGVQVPVVSSVLTTGSAGLYQITIQLPVTVATGTVQVQASVGGVQTPAGTTIFIAKQ
jgi:uncharacterized protein (TIGR03437 family)